MSQISWRRSRIGNLPKVNNVAPELNVEVSEDISAANMTAINIPLKPAGRIRNTNVG